MAVDLGNGKVLDDFGQTYNKADDAFSSVAEDEATPANQISNTHPFTSSMFDALKNVTNPAGAVKDLVDKATGGAASNAVSKATAPVVDAGISLGVFLLGLIIFVMALWIPLARPTIQAATKVAKTAML